MAGDSQSPEEVEQTPYTLTESDVSACRAILARLWDLDQTTGGYDIGHIQGYPGSATVTIHFEKRPGPHQTAQAVQIQLDSVGKLGQLCKKVIAHYNTNMMEKAT